MAQDLKKLKDNIWYAKQAFEKQEAVTKDWADQREQAQALLETDPNNEDLLAMVADITAGMEREEIALAPLREKLEALQAQLPQDSAAPSRKFDPEQHPVLKKTLEKPEPAKAIVFNTGDIVEARYRDGGWYKAKIVTILGSASAPKYKIKYTEYEDDDTLDRDALRPLQTHKRKRDVEPAPAAAPAAPAPVTSTPHVISGPASVNPKAQVVKQAVPVENNLGKRERKIPNKKQLEAKVNNWKNWNSKGVGKKIAQKDSMFRTGTNVNSRVGFTGSGSGMTETTKRVRYDNKAAAEADRERD